MRWLLIGMNLTDEQLLLAGWLGVTSFVTFLLFGYDKWQAGRRGARLAESTLWLARALGGWPGGVAGLMMFRHKSAKGSFQFKFAAAFVVWAALRWSGWQLSGKRSGNGSSGADLKTWSRTAPAAGIGQTAPRSPWLQKGNGPAREDPCG